jgi:hypothetical protein
MDVVRRRVPDCEPDSSERETACSVAGRTEMAELPWRILTWSRLRSATGTPSYVLIALPLLALLADMGVAFPLRSKLSVAGALWIAVVSLVTRILGPQSLGLPLPKNAQDTVARTRLGIAAQEDLQRYKGHLKEEDIVRSVFKFDERGGKNAEQAMTEIAKLPSDELVGARELFERVPISTIATLAGFLAAGFGISAVAVALQAIAFFLP